MMSQDVIGTDPTESRSKEPLMVALFSSTQLLEKVQRMISAFAETGFIVKNMRALKPA